MKVLCFFFTYNFHDFMRSFTRMNFSVQGLGYALGLCALFIAYKNPRDPYVSLSLEVGNIFLILGCFEEK